jgi:hypothetical protein
MLCPFCLDEAVFTRQKVATRPAPVYICPQCKEEIPSLYVRDYKSCPPVVVSAVGFRGHGKTVYFASLFYLFKKTALARQWPSFSTLCMSEEDLETVFRNVEMLESGNLPDATPKNFPRPTMIRLRGVPMQPDCTLLCYDTAGECFAKPTQLVQYAGFVRRARTAMFLVSLSKLTDPALEMHKLLNVYVTGMGQLGARTQDQNLAVVYTQADDLAQHLNGWQNLGAYLTEGTLDALASTGRYMGRMQAVSDQLRVFTAEQLQAHEFLNLARDSFRKVSFSIISALGSKPVGNRLPVQIVPRRVLDPLLWLQRKSQPWWKQAWGRFTD